LFPGVGTGAGGGHKESKNVCEYGGCILYSHMKIEE
jgi:hypothetical protein